MTIPKKLSRAKFALALELHMGRLNLTQPATAALLGVSPRQIWSWLHATVNTDFPTQHGTIEILKFTPVRKKKPTKSEPSSK